MEARIFPTLADADAAQAPCPRPCHQCGRPDRQHHWYLDGYLDEEEEDAPEDGVPVGCKHCEATALVHIDAEDLPEI